jgi:DnaJ-class molecular chaperone
MSRPPCPNCEGSGHTHGYLRVAPDASTLFGRGRGGGKTAGARRLLVEFKCPYCAGQGRVHPDTLDSWLRNKIKEEGI